MIMRYALYGVASIASLAVAGVAQAQAEEASNEGLLEIVVTAQKRKENIQDVPIAITALSAQSLAQRGITDSSRLADSVVAMQNFSPYGPGTSANVVIRGIGLNDFGDGHEAPVTTYTDELYIVSVPAVDFALFDLAGVEVLRGPQGTLFGRNSTGGLINYKTERPGFEASGFISASYARYNEVRIEGAVTAPLSDKLTSRISFVTHNSDGYVKNLNPAKPKAGDMGTGAVRGQLRLVDNGWDVLLKGEYGRRRYTQPYIEFEPATVDPVTGLYSAAPDGTDAAGYTEKGTPAAAKNVVNSDTIGDNTRAEATTVLLRIEKEAGDLTFTSISGYMHYKRKLLEDSDGTPNPVVKASFPFRGEQFTQELRLFYQSGNTKVTGGVYGLIANSQAQPQALFNIPVDFPAPVDPVTGLYTGGYFPLNLNANFDLDTKSGSIFGQVEQALTPQLTLSVGGRVTFDHKHILDKDNGAYRSCPGGDGAPDVNGTNRLCFLVADGGSGIANPYQLDYRKTLISAKAALDYRPSDNALIFASVSRGTKGGGFNNGFLNTDLNLQNIIYRDETLYAYELGSKLTSSDRRIRLNTSVFYYDYNGFQTFNYESIGGKLTNQDASVYGGEVELRVAPVRGLEVSLGGAYLHSNIKDVAGPVPGGGLYVADRTFAFAPKFSFNGSVDYIHSISSNKELSFHTDFNYRDAVFTDNINNPGAALEGYFKANVQLGLKIDNGLDFSVYVNNVTNRINTVYAGAPFGFIGNLQRRYAQPRTWGGSVRFSW